MFSKNYTVHLTKNSHTNRFKVILVNVLALSSFIMVVNRDQGTTSNFEAQKSASFLHRSNPHGLIKGVNKGLLRIMM